MFQPVVSGMLRVVAPASMAAPQNPVQKVRIAPAGVLGAELNVVASQTLGKFHGVDGNGHHLVGGLLQLILHVDLAGGDKGVDARPLGHLDGIPRHGNVFFVGSRETADYRHVAILVHLATDRVGNLLHGIEIVRRRDGKAGLNDVDAELGQVAGNFELLRRGEGGSRTLFAVPEGRVEYSHVIGIGNVSWQVFRTRAAGQIRVGIRVAVGCCGFGRDLLGRAGKSRRRSRNSSTRCAGN